MITSARIEAVKELGGIGWITCLCAPAIRKLAADDAPLQMSVLDQQDLAELSHPDYPGERLIADRNPYLAAERARMREDLLQATEKLLTAIAGQVSAGRVSGAGKIGLRARRIVNNHEVAEHLILDVGDTISPGTVTRPPSAPRPRWTASVSSTPASLPAASTPPPRSPPRRTSLARNAISGPSKLMTWTCGPSTTGLKTGSRTRAK